MYVCVCVPPFLTFLPLSHSSPSLSPLNRTTFRQAVIWLQQKHTTACVYCTFRARGNTFTSPPFLSFSPLTCLPSLSLQRTLLYTRM